MEAMSEFNKKIVFDGEIVEVFSHGVSSARFLPSAVVEIRRLEKKKGMLVVDIQFAGGREMLVFSPEHRVAGEEVLSAIEGAGGAVSP